MRVYDFTKMTPDEINSARLELERQQRRNAEKIAHDPAEAMLRRLRRPRLIDMLPKRH